MLELFSYLLVIAASYFLGWVRGTERENANCRRKLGYSFEEWENIWKKD